MVKKTNKKTTKASSKKKSSAKKTTSAKKKKSSTAKKVENENLASALAYVIIGIIWYFADENMLKSKLANFHTKQAINLWLIFVVLNFLSAILFLIGPLISTLAGIFALVFIIIGLINGLNGEKKELPIIGEAAEKYLKF